MTLKVLIDPGHSSGKKHNRGSVIGNEGDNNWKFSVLLQKYLIQGGAKADLTRTEHADPSLINRGKNSKNFDVFISNHSNAANGQARGVECYMDVNPKNQNKKLSELLCKITADTLGIPNRGVKTRKNSKGGNYYGVLRGNYAKAGMIMEYCFHDNKNDCTSYVNNMDALAKNIAKGLIEFHGGNKSVLENTKETSIMGKSIATAKQMATFLLSKNSNPKISCSALELAELFIKEGEIEGVRGDFAFAQAIKETGYFKYGGDVVPEQNNYSGIGTTGGGVKGAYFSTPQLGVQAQIQHLKAYASKQPLVQKQVDPRFHLVSRGVAPTLEGLNGKWAVPGKGYGEDIYAIYKNMIQTNGGNTMNKDINKISEWAEEAWEWAKEKGITDGTAPQRVATREEIAVMMYRAMKGEKDGKQCNCSNANGAGYRTGL